MMDFAGLIVDGLGAFAALIAILFAVQAQEDATEARKEVGRERLRQFEMEILRDLVDHVERGYLSTGLIGSPSRLQNLRYRIELLREEPRLPSWLEVMDLSPAQARAKAGLEDEINSAQSAYEEHVATKVIAADQVAWNEELGRVDAARSDLISEADRKVQTILTDELREAISSRVNAADY
jgi:hypothetical protein